ncbi:MAG: cadherin-like domain-containing protein [Trueperaceae bacterium]|nr:cadherin-like domain-containing protein [Trueperaceae bacterium]
MGTLLFGCGPGNSVPTNVTQASDIITLFSSSSNSVPLGGNVTLNWVARPVQATASLTCRLIIKTSTANSEDVVACEASLEVSPIVDSQYQLVAVQGTEQYLSDILSITVESSGQNQAPYVSGEEYELARGTRLSVSAADGVLSNDVDVNGDSLSAKLVEDVLYGELTLSADGSFSYQHDNSSHLLDFFTYVATDGKEDSSTVTVILTITEPLPKLGTQPDSYELIVGTTLLIDKASGVLANDGLDSDVTAELSKDTANGKLTLNKDGSFSYSHTGSAATTDSFSYIAVKGSQQSEPTTVNLTIKAEPQPEPEPEPTPEVLTIPIRTSGDDTEEYDLVSRSPGEMFPDSPDLDIGSDGAGDKLVGLRFTDIGLEPGTKIKDAYIQFQADESDRSNGSPKVAIYLIDEANAAPFSTSKRGLSSRKWKFMSTWEPKSWPKFSERGERQQLDVTKLVQTALDHADWKSGNAIAIVLDNYRGGLRVAESFDENPKGAASLVITTR